MWQVTNEFELSGGNIKAQDVARLTEYIIRAEEAAGVTADANKIPIVVGVSTAVMFGIPGQSMGQIEALRLAFHNGGRLPDGTQVPGNDYLNERSVWECRFVIGIQSFQYLGEVGQFVDAMWKKYEGETPILLTEHGFNSVNAASAGPPLPGNGGANDDQNQARIVAKQIADTNQLFQQYKIFRGMCYFQWLNTYYKCGTKPNNGPVVYSNKCTEANFGQVEWNGFGAGTADADKVRENDERAGLSRRHGDRQACPERGHDRLHRSLSAGPAHRRNTPRVSSSIGKKLSMRSSCSVMSLRRAERGDGREQPERWSAPFWNASAAPGPSPAEGAACAIAARTPW